MIASVFAPIPGSSRRVPAAARSRRSSTGTVSRLAAAPAVGLDPVAVGEPALEQEGDPAQRPDRVERLLLPRAAAAGGHGPPPSRSAFRADSSFFTPARREVFVHSRGTTIVAGQQGVCTSGPGVSPTASYTVVPSVFHSLCAVLHSPSPALSTGGADRPLTPARTGAYVGPR